ncbi:sensor histidine kinase [Nonomuraea sp. NPDC049646]|uniref:sensor histidine kinase n=1 Tax=unclassified Nonomuraea TaxID=2593643 RepID=UPI0037888A5A
MRKTMASRAESARKILIYWMDVMVVLLGLVFVTLVLVYATQGLMGLPQALLAIAFLAGQFALFPSVLRAAFDDRPRPTAKLLVSGVCAAGSVLLLPHDELASTATWLETGVLWVSAAAFYLPLWGTACLGAVVTVLVSAYVVAITDRSWAGTLIPEAASCALMVAAMLLWRWLWWTIRDANDGQEAKARLAIAEERLRFARDLHDLLGRSLSVITLKSELAAKLSTKDPARALAEMDEVRELARGSLAEVQLAVDGYHTLDLDAELAGVRAALEAAGARCLIETRAGDLSPAGRALLAWVVREGGTNVLKHSSATTCAITIEGGVLEMRNDGVKDLAAAPGSGLRGLSERLTTAGGSLSAAPTPTGEFLLRAAVPA